MHDPRAEQPERFAHFFASFPRASARLLLLTYDGTLAPLQVNRDRATPYPGVRTALNQLLLAGRTRIVIVTGRAAQTVPPLLGLDEPVEVWGSHGAERLLPDGTYLPSLLTPGIHTGLAEGRAWLEGAGLSDHCEEKLGSVAFHWRGLSHDERTQLHQRVELAWGEVARRFGLQIRAFDGGLELRAAGFDKGGVVRTLLPEAGPGAAVAYLGDDLTDEDAFTALEDRGLTVLVRHELRPTVAHAWLQPPDELLVFLTRWHLAAAPTSWVAGGA